MSVVDENATSDWNIKEMALLSHDPNKAYAMRSGVRRKELILLVSEVIANNWLIPCVANGLNACLLFQEPLKHCVNLVEVNRFTCEPPMLQGLLYTKDAHYGLNFKFVIYRFRPFMPQNQICTKANYACGQCPAHLFCSVGFVPIGLLETCQETRQAYPHTLHKLNDNQFRIFNIYNPFLSFNEIPEKTLGLHIPIIAYPELFIEHPELVDCFMQKPTRKGK